MTAFRYLCLLVVAVSALRMETQGELEFVSADTSLRDLYRTGRPTERVLVLESADTPVPDDTEVPDEREKWKSMKDAAAKCNPYRAGKRLLSEFVARQPKVGRRVEVRAAVPFDKTTAYCLSSKYNFRTAETVSGTLEKYDRVLGVWVIRVHHDFDAFVDNPKKIGPQNWRLVQKDVRVPQSHLQRIFVRARDFEVVPDLTKKETSKLSDFCDREVLSHMEGVFESSVAGQNVSITRGAEDELTVDFDLNGHGYSGAITFGVGHRLKLNLPHSQWVLDRRRCTPDILRWSCDQPGKQDLIWKRV